MDETKKAALKSLGFSDADITDLEARAVQTQKAADDQGVAFKADEPAAPEYPDVVLNGITYKAVPPVEAEVKDDGQGDIEAMAGGEPPIEEDLASDPNELTISDGDIAAIGQAVGAAITQALQPLMGLLDIEKKMQGHVQSMLQPFAEQQTTKDAEQAQTKEQIAALETTVKAAQAKLAELAGDQAAAPYRPSTAKDNVLTDAALLASVKQADVTDPWADIKKGLGLIAPA